ncbi:MAG: hypothetical protein N3F04_06265 [Candidatus Nezhaarchaeota archaeon]|nr:hypothetical protein [Candidatus Nezhaarchaeota archaeon]MCX8142344.1 hypothetical protein [Candidatus Nezhaarchaeota archaeon]MDW8050683.1 hypothetical protein [Nitrososphaerota archaeon]
MTSKFRIDRELIDSTHRLMELILEIDEYWRRTAPFYELNDGERGKILKLLDEVEGLVSKLKRGLSSKS